MLARLEYTSPSGASCGRYGEAADLAIVLRKRAPVGAVLRMMEGPRKGQKVGGVDPCDGGGDRCNARCTRHWHHQVGDDVGIPGVLP